MKKRTLSLIMASGGALFALGALAIAGAAHAQSPSSGYSSGTNYSSVTQPNTSSQTQAQAQTQTSATSNSAVLMSASSPSAAVTAQTTTATNDDLSIGSRGPAVSELQGILIELGHLIVPRGVPLGYFGKLTYGALLRYQTVLSVPATGVYDAPTRAAFANWLSNRGLALMPNGAVTAAGTTVISTGSAPTTGAVSNYVPGTGYWYNNVWTPRDPLKPGHGYYSTR